MQTRLVRTRQRFHLAMRSRPALATLAPVRSVRCLLEARSPIQTRLVLALADFDLAILATEARQTVARVRSLTGIETRAVVLARPMIGAVVQVLVAEQTAPAFVAIAFPFLLAGAVNAARIRFAFVAQGPFISRMASAIRRRGKEILDFFSLICLYHSE